MFMFQKFFMKVNDFYFKTSLNSTENSFKERLTFYIPKFTNMLHKRVGLKILSIFKLMGKNTKGFLVESGLKNIFN